MEIIDNKGGNKPPKHENDMKNYSNVNLIGLPQCGHLQTIPSDLGANNSYISILKKTAIFSNNCIDVLPTDARLNVTSDTPNFSANSFCVMPLFWQISLIRIFI